MELFDARPSQSEMERALTEQGENELWMLAVTLTSHYQAETAESIIKSWIDDPGSYDDDMEALDEEFTPKPSGGESIESILQNLGSDEEE
jgi:hypothetical protein